MIFMSMSPVTETSTADTRITQAPSLAAGRKMSAWRFFMIIHADTPATPAPDTRNDADSVWRKATHAVFWKRTAPMSLSTARPVSGSISKPTGCCMKALAARMKYAESAVPRAASQIMAR